MESMVMSWSFGGLRIRNRLKPPSSPSITNPTRLPCLPIASRRRTHISARSALVPPSEPAAKPIFDFHSFISLVEVVCVFSSAAFSVGFALLCASKKAVPLGVGAMLAMAAATGINAWHRRSAGSIHSGSGGGSLEQRLERVEDDLKNFAAMTRALSRHLEKLGIRFRLTRKALKDPIAETAALAQKNSEATRELAMQHHILEKELSEIQKLLLAMQEQQQKQLELILAIANSANTPDYTQQQRQQHKEPRQI